MQVTHVTFVTGTPRPGALGDRVAAAEDLPGMLLTVEEEANWFSSFSLVLPVNTSWGVYKIFSREKVTEAQVRMQPRRGSNKSSSSLPV